jgi:hypothetical protein
VTNWLTAAGLALFAGGLATLICFRAVLFGDGGKSSGRGARAATARRTAIVEQPAPRRIEAPVAARPAWAEEEGDDGGGLASIGFAHDDADDDLEADVVQRHEDPDEDPEPPTVLDRTPRLVGHRVEGWVRPEYRDVPSGEAGDYWTPLPGQPRETHRGEPSAHGYGWPVQVERLPPVPSYEPATGFDLKPVEAEPTELVPAWSEAGDEHAGRIHLPRSWSSREDEGWSIRDEKPRRRPRPRPRPSASSDGVYVSRHAADPPR